jgi:beta-lactamase regulating signal transducer with metallopeptidase domain
MRFLNLFEITAEVSVLIVLIGIIQMALKKRLNPNIRYFLWIFVAVRILVPFQFEFSVELPKQLENVPIKVISEEPTNFQSENYTLDNLPIEGLTAGDLSEPVIDETTDVKSEEKGIDKYELFLCIWIFGVGVMSLYVSLNNMRLCTRLKKHRQEIGTLPNGIPLYSVYGYNCLNGIIFPAIYVDVEHLQDDKIIDNVIQHELQHYKVKDNIWQFIRVICLIVQWYNPLVWWAYVASKRDCELACDARTVSGMSEKERYEYGKSLLVVIEYTFKEKQNMNLTTPMVGNKKFMEQRIKIIIKYKKKRAVFISAVIICMVVIVGFISVKMYKNNDINDTDNQEASADVSTEEQTDDVNVVLDIQDYYIINTGDPSNLYYIDEDKVLWGCGRNNYGQLGQGTQDYDFHDEMVKIAENVIHIDYSQTGFTIFLTDDHKLYGMGNAGCGALQQYDEFTWDKYVNAESYTVTTPYLLMENVIYARCGREDIACMTEDKSVWIWGTIGYNGIQSYFEPKPVKVLENAALITGGLYNHAALLADGTVWTWGYNYSGNCGVEFEKGTIIPTPTQVAEDVVMVWTESTKLNVDCYDISEFDGVYEKGMENTIICKKDGSYWACGLNVGDEEIIPPIYVQYDEEIDYTVVCSDKFLPFDEVQ